MIKQVELNLDNFGVSKFLFYKAAGSEAVDGARIDWLKNSRIPGVLPCIAIQKDEDVYIRYDLVSETTLRKKHSVITRDTLCKALMDLAETLVEAQAGGLDTENFVLNKDQIFIDSFSGRLVFIYLPVKNHAFEKRSLKEFLQEFITMAPYDEQDDARFFIKLHNYLLQTKEISPTDLSEKLREWAADSEIPFFQQDWKRQPHYYSPGSPAAEVDTPVQQGVVTSEYSSQKKDKKTGRKLEIEEEVQYKRITRTELGDNSSLLKDAASLGGTSISILPNVGTPAKDEVEEEGTTVLGAAGEEEEGTTFLGLEPSVKPFLLASATNERITIDKSLFKMGRDPLQTHYTSKNSVVGRVHAQLLTIDGEYFFEDNHSTNGSFVNGVKLQPKQRQKIRHEDRIRLANEEFVFRLF
ncbi:DUF6382 domain-containing protein [Mesobacillus foraminis]|uniref:DUF6382 domain-containing protein n=1 Tax=Mesobacillus foraminis TaxID=279826 RepID=UPI000EF556EC|nr:DUF6382 domain-containing protein [Mesobacillus foraminis]